MRFRHHAAAAADSAARAKKDKNDPNRYVDAVGELQIVTRRGVLAAGAQP